MRHLCTFIQTTIELDICNFFVVFEVYTRVNILYKYVRLLYVVYNINGYLDNTDPNIGANAFS